MNATSFVVPDNSYRSGLEEEDKKTEEKNIHESSVKVYTIIYYKSVQIYNDNF